jgi:hypothetical protein
MEDYMAFTRPEPELWRYHNAETGTRWLTEDPDFEAYADYEGVTWQKIGLEEATAVELAELMDAAMENANYHDSAGIHRYLAGVLTHQVGGSAALRIMAEIYTEHGWLAEIHQ